MSESLDLNDYFVRIGLEPVTEPTLEALHALTFAHSSSIPFENIDILLGRMISLEQAALHRKLIAQARGGYCFEQNGLFLDVLSRLGYAVRPLRAGVRLGRDSRAEPVGHTHLALEVQIAGERWLTDVGIGSYSLAQALQLIPDQEQSTPHDTRRFQVEHDRWYLQVRQGERWVDVYEFSRDRMELPDRIIANWYTSTHPNSGFRQRLAVAKAEPRGERLSLRNKVLSRRQLNGASDKRTLTTEAELRQALNDCFGIKLPKETALPAWIFAAAERPAREA